MLTRLTVLKPNAHLIFTRRERMKPGSEFLQSEVHVQD